MKGRWWSRFRRKAQPTASSNSGHSSSPSPRPIGASWPAPRRTARLEAQVGRGPPVERFLLDYHHYLSKQRGAVAAQPFHFPLSCLPTTDTPLHIDAPSITLTAQEPYKYQSSSSLCKQEPFSQLRACGARQVHKALLATARPKLTTICLRPDRPRGMA